MLWPRRGLRVATSFKIFRSVRSSIQRCCCSSYAKYIPPETGSNPSSLSRPHPPLLPPPYLSAAARAGPVARVRARAPQLPGKGGLSPDGDRSTGSRGPDGGLSAGSCRPGGRLSAVPRVVPIPRCICCFPYLHSAALPP